MTHHRHAIVLPMLLSGCLPIVRLHTNEPFTAANVAIVSSGIHSVQIEVNTGRIALQKSSDDTIRVNVQLASHDSMRLANTCSRSTRLSQESSAGRLRLRLEQASRDQCGERWTVELPSSLDVDVAIRVGDVVSDVTVKSFSAKVGVLGSVKGSVESDEVVVNVRQGDIDLTTRAGDLHLARVESDLGRVALEFRGMEVKAANRPGRGAVAEMTGRGKGKIVAHTKHGSASLTVR